MKIAVTYENGQIFQHFGHSESFKIYEAEGKNIVRAEVIGTDGAGHSALAAVLKDKGVDVLICGGIGNGAVTALSEAGIDVYSGADGEADAAVEAYLNGDLTSAGVNCDHHHDHEEGHGCGHCGSHEDEESGCGHCGSDDEESAADTVEVMKVNQTVVVVVADAAVAAVHLNHHLKDLMWERR